MVQQQRWTTWDSDQYTSLKSREWENRERGGGEGARGREGEREGGRERERERERDRQTEIDRYMDR